MTDQDRMLREQAYAEVKKYKDIVESDPYRLKYHLMPPVGLLNDPNGFIQFKGTYHLFYQWNPFNTGHGAKFWGHYSSKNLVDWQHHDIALAPSDWFDKNGCYSGSAIEHEGKMYLFYTGNVKDENNQRKTYQVMAESKDGETFEKKGVVIELPEGYTAHFRDPKVWVQNGQFYMIIGAQSEDFTGKAVLFRSTDLLNWEHLGSIAGAHLGPFAEFGYMWECPDLMELDGKDVLIFSPQGLEPEGIHYQNLYQAGYVVGKLDYEKIKFEHGTFTELDRGFEFYAPQTTLDETGRRILIGWLGMPEEREDVHPTIEYNWIHAMTLPRELTLKEGKLYQKPVEELKMLRKEAVYDADVELTSEPKALLGVEEEALELLVEVNDSRTSSFEIQIRNVAKIGYNPIDKLFKLERVSFADGETIEKRFCQVEHVSEIHVFLDTSSIEVFINGGEEVFTARIYPKENEKRILFSAEDMLEMNVKAWKL